MTFKRRLARRIVGTLALLLVVASIVMLLWNAIVPSVFAGVQALNYLQAVGLLLLSRILLGGLPGRGGRPAHRRRPWAALSPQERERLRRHLHDDEA